MDISGYVYKNSEINHSHEYFLPKVLGLLQELAGNLQIKALF